MTLEGNDIALFKVGGIFHAMDNTCSHAGGPLGEGELEPTAEEIETLKAFIEGKL